MDRIETLGIPNALDSAALQAATPLVIPRLSEPADAEERNRRFYCTGLLAFFSPFEAAVDAADEGDRAAVARSPR